MAIDIGLWRSTRGDTHPHIGIDVAWDYWPQGTHIVWEAPALVTCASGGGGGSQQAMFKQHLDPVLAGALERWNKSPVGGTPASAMERWFGEIQAGFEAMTEPAWADEFSATAVALLVRPDGAALGHVAMDRCYRWRAGRLEQLTTDVTLADHGAKQRGQQLPDWFLETPGAMLRKRTPEREAFIRWEVGALDVAPGDLFLLVSGMHDTGLTTSYLAGALEQIFEGPVAGAQDVATRIGDIVTRFGEVSSAKSRAEVRIHSRTALAVVWIDQMM